MLEALDPLVSQVEQTIGQRRLFTDGQAILVAVSGGMDSMVLLHLLQRLASKHRWRLAVIHFNHRLRGAASEADEALVRATARKLGLPCHCARARPGCLQERRGVSLEMAARQARHDFFAWMAHRLKVSTLALAHHADDQVELFFLRLLRGAGGFGLRGMAWCSPSPSQPRLQLIRPLLDCPKSELLDFAKSEQVPFREDASNRCLEIPRNRVRRQLLPLLVKDYQPALREVIRRTIAVVGAETAYVEEAARAWLASLRGTRRSASLPGESFDELHVAVQRRALQCQLLELGVEPDFALIEQLRSAAGQAVMVSPGVTVLREASGQIHRRLMKGRRPTEFRGDLLRLPLDERGGTATFGSLRIGWKFQPWTLGAKVGQCCPPGGQAERCRSPGGRGPTSGGFGQELFDADRVGPAIVLRHWRTGDRFQPIGLSHSVKLQDLFVNQKIPRPDRHRLVVAESAGRGIFWVQGFRIGERFKLDKLTRRCLIWCWQDTGR